MSKLVNSAHIRSKSPPKTRTALINHKPVTIDGEKITEPKVLPQNRVVTSKYTIINFLPKNLFEQFRRIANFYFLVIAIIQCSTDTPVSPVTSLVPLVFVVFTTALKQAYEDWLRHRADRIVNKKQVPVLVGSKVLKIKSELISIGDVVYVVDDEEVPCDLVILSSSLPTGKCSVTTANLDGETNLKVRDCPPCTQHYQQAEDFQNINGIVECEQPNTDLYEFVGVLRLCHSGKVETYPLGPNNILLRGSRLKNSGHVYGVAVYTGRETKMAMNSKLTSNKFSSVEKKVNLYLAVYCVILLCISLVCYVARIVYNSIPDIGSPWYLSISKPSIDYGPTEFLSFFVLFNYLIPISLYVSLEMVKFFGSKTLVSDTELFNVESQERPICNSSDLNEELGQVEFLFSDKTGTLTENTMLFTSCTINGLLYEERNRKLCLLNVKTNTLKDCLITGEIEQFFVDLCLCNTVHVSFEKNDYVYHADSPDEKALVEAAHRFGITLVESTSKESVIRIRNEKKKFEKLHIFEFDSSRKRMSVIIRDEKGSIFLVCKGAETALSELISAGKVKETYNTVEKYSCDGLRTLVIGMKEFTEEQYTAVNEMIFQTSKVLTNRKENLAGLYGKLEGNLKVLGATAVEDRLQEGVAETITDLKSAGIKVWVLTGDKLETAVSVAYSCHLLESHMIQFMLARQQNAEGCDELIKRFSDAIQEAKNSKIDDIRHRSHALIADGRSLYMAMKFYKIPLQKLCENCDVVLCCRMSPIQKAEVVHMMKMSGNRPVTAAIGDGANDVSMIQEAHVGFGLMGKEGRQAVNSSDFAFSKFRFIRRALLVHGHLFYIRVATLIHYFFYKNIVFVTPQFIFAFYNAFSAQTLYHGMLLMAYNVLFTAVPIFVYGVTEKYIPSEILDKFPELYKMIRQNRHMNFCQFFKWFLLGIFHGSISFFCFKDIWGTGTTLYSSGQFGGLYAFGTIIYHSVILITNFKLMVMTRDWNIYFTSAVAISLLCVPVFCMVYTSFKWSFINDDLYGVYKPLLISFGFWSSLIVVLTIALIPDVLYLVLRNSFNFNQFPSLIGKRE